MKTVKFGALLMMGLVFVLFIAGCGDNGPTSPDEQEIQDLIESSYSAYFSFGGAFYCDDELLKDDSAPYFDSLYNWRYTDRDVDRSISIDIDGDTADVEIEYTFSATAIFRGWVAGTLATYDRPVEFSGTRYATFVREDSLWRLAEISLVNIKTDESMSLIDSVVITDYSTGEDYTVSFPGTLIPVDELFTFNSGDSIGVEVFTSEDCFAQYRHPNFASYRRDRMDEDSPRRHRYHTIVHSLEGVKRFVIDVVTQDSGLDMNGSQVGEIWIILAQATEEETF